MAKKKSRKKTKKKAKRGKKKTKAKKARCAAITKSGKRCKRPASGRSKYCTVHKKSK